LLYLDANFFIFALLDRTDRGLKARIIQRKIAEGKMEAAVTSSLALDEVMWVLIKNKKDYLLRIAIEGIYSIPNIDVIGVSSTVPIIALDFFERYGLKPRDSFHLAIMKENGIDKIVTDDKDFDKVETISRVEF